MRHWFAQRQSLVLLGPALGYLLVFSLFPLLYSLGISFYEFDVIESDWEFVGLDNYARCGRTGVLGGGADTALMVGVGVVVQSVLGTALALFFNLHLRGTAFVRGLLVLPMILNPVVVGLMWRALLNPDWGIVNWCSAGSASLAAELARRPGGRQVGAHLRRRVAVDAVRVHHRVRPAAGAARGHLRGGRGGRRRPWGRLTQITLPLLASAIVFAGIFRAIDAFRTFDLVFGLTYGGPGRTTTTLSFYGFETGFSFTRYGFSSAIAYVMVIIAAVASSVLLRRVDIRREDAR